MDVARRRIDRADPVRHRLAQVFQIQHPAEAELGEFLVVLVRQHEAGGAGGEHEAERNRALAQRGHPDIELPARRQAVRGQSLPESAICVRGEAQIAILPCQPRVALHRSQVGVQSGRRRRIRIAHVPDRRAGLAQKFARVGLNPLHGFGRRVGLEGGLERIDNRASTRQRDAVAGVRRQCPQQSRPLRRGIVQRSEAQHVPSRHLVEQCAHQGLRRGIGLSRHAGKRAQWLVEPRQREVAQPLRAPLDHGEDRHRPAGVIVSGDHRGVARPRCAHAVRVHPVGIPGIGEQALLRGAGGQALLPRRRQGGQLPAASPLHPRLDRSVHGLITECWPSMPSCGMITSGLF